MGTFGFPVNYLRVLCRKAGVLIYVDSDDVVSADEHFLALSATTAGEKTMWLLFAGALTNLSSGERVVLPEGQPLVLTFAKGETRLFSIYAVWWLVPKTSHLMSGYFYLIIGSIVEPDYDFRLYG